MMDPMIDPQDYKKFKIPVEYIVSGKSVTFRMWVFLTQIVPAMYDSIETDQDRILALYRLHKIDARLLAVSMKAGTPLNTVLVYVEKINVASWEMIQKDVGSWEIDE